MTAQTASRFSWLPLLLTALVFAAANGIGYGGGNLQQYLLHGLHAADPDFLSRDWFTVETRPHHVLFTALLGSVTRTIPPHIALGALNLICASIFAVCVHAIARRLHRMPLLVTTVTLIILLGSPRSPIALVSILTSYFQPSTVGAVGLLGGMILLARRRWRAAALALATAGVFHIGYAIWVELLIATVVLLHFQTLGRRHAAEFIAVGAIVAAMHLPFFFAAHGPDQLPWTAQAGKILHDVYMPYHSRPRTWPAEQWIRTACVLAAGVAALAVRGRARSLLPVERTLAGFVLLISLLGVLLTLVFEWNLMAMLLPYRILLIAILAAQVAAAAALIPDRTNERSWIRALAIPTCIFILLRASGLSAYAGVPIAFASGVMFVDCAARDLRRSMLNAIAAGLAVCLLIGLAGAGRNTLAAFSVVTVAILFHHRPPQAIAGQFRLPRFNLARAGLAAVMAIQLAWMGRAAANRKDVMREPSPPAQAELFAWCREHTPADAVFAIPPDLAGFRLHARRATVIDYKCMPILPADTVRWAARLAEVCGRPIRAIEDAIAGYREMNADRAADLNARYGVAYVVVEKQPGAADPDWASPPIFSNRTYSIHVVAPACRQIESDDLAEATLGPPVGIAGVPN